MTEFVFTHPVRMFFPALVTAKAYTPTAGKPQGEPRYSANFLVPPDHPDLNAFKALCAKLFKEKWPGKDLGAKDGNGKSPYGWPWRNGDLQANRKQATNLGKKILDPKDPSKGEDTYAFQRGHLVIIGRSKDAPALGIFRGQEKVQLSGDAAKAVQSSHFYEGVNAVPSFDVYAWEGNGDEGPKPYMLAQLKAVLSMVSVAGTDNGARLPRRSAKSINETFSGIVGSVSNESVTDKPDDEIPF